MIENKFRQFVYEKLTILYDAMAPGIIYELYDPIEDLFGEYTNEDVKKWMDELETTDLILKNRLQEIMREANLLWKAIGENE